MVLSGIEETMGMNEIDQGEEVVGRLTMSNAPGSPSDPSKDGGSLLYME